MMAAGSAAAYEIRTATPDDAARLRDLMRDTFIASNGHASTPENIDAFLAATYNEGRQRDEIADPDVLTLILAPSPGDAWAGFAQLRFATIPPPEVVLSRPVELFRLYMAPTFHGRGAAAALMRRVVEETRARGGDGLWLNVWQESAPTQRFYAKQGFRIVGRSQFILGDDAMDDWVMMRELGPADAPELLTFDGDVAEYRPVGEFTYPRLVGLMTTAITQVRELGLRKILIDITAVTGLRPPSLGQRHGMLRDWAVAAQGRVSMAMVCPPEFIDPYRFGVVVAANFGMTGDVFTQRDEALAWLRDGNAA